MNLDLKTIMAELHYGAEHFTDEERNFFDGVWKAFKQSGGITPAHAQPVLDLYKKLKFRQIDPNEVVANLEANLLLLSDLEQSQVEGARFTLEYSGGTLDMATLGQMLAIRQALFQRQHNTLTTRQDGIQVAVKTSVLQPVRALPGAPIQAEPPRRPSARRNSLGPIPSLEAARKLLKGGH